MSRMPSCLRGALLALSVLASSHAFAACKPTSSWKTKTLEIGMGQIVVQNKGQAIGSVLASREFPISVSGASDKIGHCSGTGVSVGAVRKGQEMASHPGVFETSVSGIGIKFTRVFRPGDESSLPFERQHKHGSQYLYAGALMRVELVKTAPITASGPLEAGIYTSEFFEQGVAIIETNMPAGGTTVISRSCAVNAGSRNIPVKLGPVPRKDFKGVGTIAQKREFPIWLDCNTDPGTLGLHLKFDGVPDRSNMAGVLELTQQAGVAKGVGILLLDSKDAPIDLDQSLPVVPTQHGEFVVPMRAAYIQTSPVVTGGVANGTATFTLTYK